MNDTLTQLLTSKVSVVSRNPSPSVSFSHQKNSIQAIRDRLQRGDQRLRGRTPLGGGSSAACEQPRCQIAGAGGKGRLQWTRVRVTMCLCAFYEDDLR